MKLPVPGTVCVDVGHRLSVAVLRRICAIPEVTSVLRSGDEMAIIAALDLEMDVSQYTTVEERRRVKYAAEDALKARIREAVKAGEADDAKDVEELQRQHMKLMEEMRARKRNDAENPR